MICVLLSKGLIRNVKSVDKTCLWVRVGIPRVCHQPQIRQGLATDHSRTQKMPKRGVWTPPSPLSKALFFGIFGSLEWIESPFPGKNAILGVPPQKWHFWHFSGMPTRPHRQVLSTDLTYPTYINLNILLHNTHFVIAHFH